MYEPRWYRQDMGARFKSIEYSYLETDIWIAYDITSTISETKILSLIDKKTKELHRLFNDHFYIHSEFKHSLVPIEVDASNPVIIQELCKISQKTGVGPMAGIAAVFAREIGILCKKEFGFKEIIIENGGDIYLDIQENISVRLFAGEHPLSNKIHIIVEASESPLGLCASSGTFGHSLSLGKADLVAVACKDPILADQLATALANEIQDASDIKKLLNDHKYDKDILSLMIFADKEFGMKGKFKLKEF
jgi:hypothetical protein